MWALSLLRSAFGVTMGGLHRPPWRSVPEESPVTAASPSVPRALLGLAAAASLVALCFSDALVVEASGAPVPGVSGASVSR